MTESYTFISKPNGVPEVILQWDDTGKLVFVHPTIIAHVREELSLDNVIRVNTELQAQVTALEQQYDALLVDLRSGAAFG